MMTQMKSPQCLLLLEVEASKYWASLVGAMILGAVYSFSKELRISILNKPMLMMNKAIVTK